MRGSSGTSLAATPAPATTSRTSAVAARPGASPRSEPLRPCTARAGRRGGHSATPGERAAPTAVTPHAGSRRCGGGRRSGQVPLRAPARARRIVCAPKPPAAEPSFGSRERAGTQMLRRVVDRENRSISAGERQETRIEVLVHVNNVGSPPAKLPSDLEHHRDRSDRTDAARDDEHADAVALESLQDVTSLHHRPTELQGVVAAEHRNVVTGPNQRSRLLRSILNRKSQTIRMRTGITIPDGCDHGT